MPDTIDALLRRHAAAVPTKPMVIDPETRVDYRTMDATTRELAAAFVGGGVGKGTRVGLIMPNGARWIEIAFALTRVGAVLVPLSTLLSPRELLAQLRIASVQYLIAVDEFLGHSYLAGLAAELTLDHVDDVVLHHPALPALRRVWTADTVAALPRDDDVRAVVDAMTAAVTPSDALAVVFTSGSSGMPKGVIHSHGSALGAVRSGLDPRCIDADTRLYLPMPFFWVGGLGGGVLSALVAGATLVTEPHPRPETTLRLIERERVTLFRGWPEQARALAEQPDSVLADLSSLKPGSLEALLPPRLRSHEGARATLFGMTESFGPYCGYRADTDMPESALGSCGRPFAGMEVRIVDVEDGTPCDAGSTGLIQIRGPHTLRGICRRTREDTFTVDGFYPTGDLGRLDEQGFLFYQGRADDMFKVGGATVYPSEVESALRTIDGVRGAFVTNVPSERGDRVGAVVVCGPGPDHVRRAARTVLSSFKVPTVWLELDTDERVPRGPTGKVDTRRLRDMLSDAEKLEAQP